MIVARIGDTGYNIVLILHLLFMVVAFAPAFVWPVLNRLQRTLATSADPNDTGGEDRVTTSAVAHVVDPMMHGGSMVLTGAFGVILVLLSNDVFEFSQTWISISFVLWFAMLLLFFIGLVPAQRSVRAGHAAADSRLAMTYGGLHLLLLLQIIVMVWKPGF